MALHNNSEMYSGGAVVFDNRQPINLYAQLLQRKQAREEALDAYEMNRVNRMNEAGVRDIDRPGLDAKVIDMKTYYQANKDRIRKGGTPEAYNYEKMFRDTLSGVSKSKNATATAETFNKIRLERQKLGRNTPEDWFNEYSQHEDTPVWDEKFKDLDLPKYMQQNQVKYDPKTVKDLVSDLKRTPGSPRYEDIPGDKYTRNKFIDESFDQNAKETIAARTHDLYDANDGFANAVQQDVNNPIKRGQYEQTFQKEFGTAPQSMADYATAKVLSEVQSTVTGKPVKEEKWEERRRLLQGFHQANMAVMNQFRQMDKANQDFYIDSIIDDNLKEGQKGNGEFQASPLVLKTLGQFNVPAEAMRVTPDGNFEYKFDNQWKPLSANTYKAHLRDIFQAKAGAPEIKKAEQTKKPEYSQITETDKGTLGVKDGKWYYIKTGKPYQ